MFPCKLRFQPEVQLENEILQLLIYYKIIPKQSQWNANIYCIHWIYTQVSIVYPCNAIFYSLSV